MRLEAKAQQIRAEFVIIG